MTDRTVTTETTEEEKARLAEEQLKRAAQDKIDLKAVMSTEGGRRALARIIDYCGVSRESFIPSSKIYYNEGQRSIGIMLQDNMQQVDMHLYITMLTETLRRNQ